MEIEHLTLRSPNFGQKDLYEAIEKGDYPSWTMQVQMMTQQEAEKLWTEKRINVFDLTHIWPHEDFPLRTIGKMTLNENPKVSVNNSLGTLTNRTVELLRRG